MRIVTPFVLAAFVGLAIAPAVFAQTNASAANAQSLPADPTNAALAYWRVWSLEAATLADKVKEQYVAEKGVAPESDLATLLRTPETRTTINQIIAASRLPECDFGIAYSDGFMALLPHLGKLRASGRLLIADAALASAEGRHADAAGNVAAVYRMGRHLHGERTLISCLVAQAVIASGHARVRAMIDASQLSRESAAALQAELARFPEEDMFSIRASLAAEGSLVASWTDRTYTGPDAGARFVEDVVDAGTVEATPGVPAIRAMNEDALRASVVQVRKYYDECLAVFDPNDPGAEDRLASLAKDVVDGKYGPLAQVIAPSTVNVLRADKKHRAELMSIRDLLASIK